MWQIMRVAHIMDHMSTATITRTEHNLSDIVNINISMALAAVGANQSELARAIGMNQTSINRRFTGLTDWRLTDIEAVADVLGTSPAELLTPPANMDAIMQRKLNKHPADGSHRMGALARSKGFEPPTF